MPEGDNVLRSATVLGRELSGRQLTSLELRDLGEVTELRGQQIGSIRALGKHLLIDLGPDWTLRVHLGMHGRWVRRHVREPRSPRRIVTLIAGDVAYICERAYTAELVRASALRAHARLARLGPDLLAEPPDIDGAVTRALLPAHADREIGELLLDQRIAAGIGNIYKSETLFECRIHPRTHIRRLGRARLVVIFEAAARLMRLNLLIRRRSPVPVRRREVPTRHRFAVYRRDRQPCFDCGTPIEWFLQGDHGRSTYFCPRCQPEQSLA
jgi:endonuclease-8